MSGYVILKMIVKKFYFVIIREVYNPIVSSYLTSFNAVSHVVSKYEIFL